MVIPLVLVITLSAGAQTPAADRSRAEDLARSGRNAEALELFARVVEVNPADVEARLWMARLALRLGRTPDAEAGFRAVLRDHPAVSTRGLASAWRSRGTDPGTTRWRF
jgi:uncharacterized membrane-anchored protein